LQIDENGACTGIKAVLDQLFDDGRRPLDHLAGSDLVNEMFGELSDWHQESARRNRRDTSGMRGIPSRVNGRQRASRPPFFQMQ
jgi:hypothetical protein